MTPKTYTRLLLFALIPFVAIACQKPQAPLQHSVYIWMNEPGHPEHREALINATHELKASIPEVRTLAVGVPLPPDRPIVVDDYDVGFVMGFDSVEDLLIYQDHPAHVEIVDSTIRPLSSRIVVYDFIDTSMVQQPAAVEDERTE